MKKVEKKALQAKLLSAIKRVIKTNHAYLSNKIEKALEKSIKKIVKKTSQKMDMPSKPKPKLKTKRAVLSSHKYSLDGRNGVGSKKTV